MRYAIATLIMAVIAASFIPKEDSLGYKIGKQIEERRKMMENL